MVVIADTHGRPHPRALERIAALGPRLILHAGDIGDAAFLADFERVAPVVAVAGNIDPPTWPETRLISLEEPSGRPGHSGQLEPARSPRLRLLLTHIAVSGVRPTREALEAARQHAVDLIVCGHSHVPFIAPAEAGERPLTLFNPGSIGPRRFHLPIVFGVLRLGMSGGTSLVHVDAETGAIWTPP